MNEYIVVRALIAVMCVLRHFVTSAVLEDINKYIVVSILIAVMCVIRHSVTRIV